MKNSINPTVQAYRRYLIEFGIAMAAYVVVISICCWFAHDLNGGWRIAIVLLPIIPVGFIFASIVRFLFRTDEFIRKATVESLALAGGATALIAATYGLLEAAGFPKQSAWWTYAAFMIGWIIASPFVWRRYK